MKAIVYSEQGSADVLRLVERAVPEPGPGQVRVAVRVSGVNPTDWKNRAGGRGTMPFPEVVPNQDGAGVIEAVGSGVEPARMGERVWLWEAQWRRPDGTAQEFVALDTAHAVRLPDGASFDLGASLGIPAMTAHRCLTTFEGSTGRLGPDALADMSVLVAGGAGAVGNAAIQLARWAGARVLSTVSSAEKAALAAAAGAQIVVNYREGDPGAAIRAAAPEGVDVIVEVAPIANEAVDRAVLRPGGTIAGYAVEPAGELTVPVFPLMSGNIRYQWLLVYTMPAAAKAAAVEDVSRAVADGAIRVGPEAGLPLHHFSLAETPAAHRASESGAVGKVLIDVS